MLKERQSDVADAAVQHILRDRVFNLEYVDDIALLNDSA